MIETRPKRCPLCQHPDSNSMPVNQPHAWGFQCPRCGDYCLSSLLYKNNRLLFTSDPEQEDLFRLACVASEWRLKHTGYPRRRFVLADEGSFQYPPQAMFPEARIFMLDEMLNAFPNGSDLFDRSLLNLSRLVRHPMESVHRSIQDWAYLLFCPSKYLELHVRWLTEMGFLGRYASPNDSYEFYVAPGGWKRITELGRATSDSQQAFVAMWFSGEMDPFYRKGIKPAVEDSGYKVQRIDEKEHINDVRDEIMAEIRQSRFVVADFTGQRGGVYFEAGFAQGLGLPVIWTVRQDQIGDLHFDTRQYSHLFYETPEELRVKLHNRIVATIGQGPVPVNREANA